MTGNIPYEKVIIDFFSWLNVHRSGYLMRHEAMDWEMDYGYIKACNCIESELKRLLEECMDEIHRIDGDKGLLEQEIS